MAFYIRKNLESGPLRFAVGERTPDARDDDPRFSTGPKGEYRPIRNTSLYFGEQRDGDGVELTNIAQFPALENEPVLSPLMWSSVGVGVIILLAGVGVLAVKKDMIGIIEILIGLAMIITPFVRTMQKRREVKAKREKILAERAAEEARLQALIGSFAERVRGLRSRRDEQALVEIARERSSIDVPYEAVVATSRPILTSIAFELTAAYPDRSLDETAKELTACARAIGLGADDVTSILAEIVRRVIWHLLSDDRMNDEMVKNVDSLARAFQIPDEALGAERAAIAEFRTLRGLQMRTLSPKRAELPLGFNEACLHQTVGVNASKKRATEGLVYVTTKRLSIVNGKQDDTQLASIYDVELDADASTIHLKLADRKKNFAIRTHKPIETAAILEIISAHARATAMML